MTVKKLIEILKTAPENARVLMYLGENEEADAPLKAAALVNMCVREEEPYYVKDDAYIVEEPFAGKKVVVLTDLDDGSLRGEKGVRYLRAKPKAPQPEA